VKREREESERRAKGEGKKSEEREKRERKQSGRRATGEGKKSEKRQKRERERRVKAK
jgi:hypothetical protein